MCMDAALARFSLSFRRRGARERARTFAQRMARSSSSFRRKPESSVSSLARHSRDEARVRAPEHSRSEWPVRASAERRESSGNPVLVLDSSGAPAFARPSAARVTFLARARKVTKRTRPSACRPPRILRCGFGFGFASAPCARLNSSFRRKPESSVFVLYLDLRAKAFARPSAERVTFLARARKVTKRTRPSVCRPPRILRCGSASAACVPRIAHPCAIRGIGAIHRAAPAGIAASAAAMRWGPRAARVVRAEAKQQQEQTPEQKSVSATRFCFFLRRARRAPLSIYRGPHRIAAAAVDQAPAGGRRGTAPTSRGTGTYLPRSPAADADPERRMREGRYALGRVLLVTFLARARKVTRSTEGRAKALALRQRSKAKTLDSGFRRNDEQKDQKPNYTRQSGLRRNDEQEKWIPAFARMASPIKSKNWIPAFAGMTTKERSARS